MNDLLAPVLLVIAILAAVSGLLYGLTIIDPQTDRAERATQPQPDMNAHRARPDRQWHDVVVGGSIIGGVIVLLIVLRLAFG